MHLAKQQAFQQFLYEFHVTRDYFECHEIFEDLWKDIAPRQKQHELVGFILFATGMYHWRRGNQSGGTRSFHKAYVLLEQAVVDKDSFLMNFDRAKLLQLIRKSEQLCKDGAPYQSVVLPIVDEEFLTVIPMSTDNRYPLPDEIVHKHRLRDRSDVIKERELAKQQRHSTH